METSSRQTILASVTLSLCLVSDSLLYLLLPLYFEDFGLAFIWVGILLSVNRLIRILLQSWLVTWYEILGVRNTVLLSVILAGVGCSFFSYNASIYWLLAARLMWGVAYSLMRMSCLFLATSDRKNNLTKLAWYSSVQEIGPLTVLIITPWLTQFINPHSIMIIPLVLCFVALIPALMLDSRHLLPRKGYDAVKSHSWFPGWNNDHAITFMISLLYDGLWVIALAPLFVLSGLTQEQTLNTVAMLLVTRRSMNLVLGYYFVRFKSVVAPEKIISLSILGIIVASVLIYFNQIVLGSVLAIVGRGFYMLFIPKVLSDAKESLSDKKQAVNAFTVWRDIASAVGAFLAGVLLDFNVSQPFFLLLAALMTGLLIKRYLKFLAAKTIYNV